MKVLIISCSPRVDGNSDQLADAFGRGAVAAGHTVERVRLRTLKLLPCIACDRCFSTGSPCVQNDDMDQVYQALDKCDLVAFAMPLYFYTFPANLKMVIDRLYAYYSKERAFVRQAVLLAAAADNAPNTFDALKLSYEILLNYLGWKDAGQLFAFEVMEKGDVARSGKLAEAEKLGASLR